MIGAQPALAVLRQLWPRFLTARTLMVGCAAGEGHLDGDDEMPHEVQVRLLRDWIPFHAERLGAPARRLQGISGEVPRRARLPSRRRLHPRAELPDDAARHRLSLLRGLHGRCAVAQDAAGPAPQVPRRRGGGPDHAHGDERHHGAHRRTLSALSPKYSRGRSCVSRSSRPNSSASSASGCPTRCATSYGRKEGRAVAFSLCMVAGEDIFAEYLGLDYGCALDLHLYHYAFRDVVRWAMANGYKRFRSTGLNYDPKLHLRARLDPLDLYVRHCSPLVNRVLARRPARARTHPCRSGAAPVPQLRRNVGVDSMISRLGCIFVRGSRSCWNCRHFEDRKVRPAVRSSSWP